ncbi:cell wall-binding repeat-containing protein [Microbacterium sp. ARD32]|uniref:cell wall-binding repeat-containing protein n=1 Tax=Microbacterium sp. ARD32 TaxID=2962577 RepID=UPI002880CEC3|nr:cell wall-binding repeat-containing protein [Microbacterium sp. ARD32]MDT0156751.1 cell wall-binding repeat-containing protein [Microbacterium sp. ARD32]
MLLSILLTTGVLTAAPATAATGLATTAVATAVRTGASVPAKVTRLAGADRYETAVAVSRNFAPEAPVAYVATGQDYPDALSAAAAAAAAGAPLLLTQRTLLPAAVRAELRRLRPARIVVVGGTGVISAAVASALSAIAPTSRRSGADRYLTSAALVSSAFGAKGAEHVFLATGRTFPDALAASGAAGAEAAPVLLVDGASSAVPAATMKLLSALGTRRVSIAGGYGAVSAGQQAQLQKAGLTVERYAGSSRYGTAAAINEAFFAPGDASQIFLATGADFPDALAGAALAGALGAPIHVVQQKCAPPAVRSAARAFGAKQRIALGGTAVVSDRAAALTSCAPGDARGLPADYATTGWTLPADAPTPYADRSPIDVRSAAQRVDATGLRIYERPGLGRVDHPVVYAQYGISALAEYQRTGERLWLDRAVRQGERLIEMRTLRGDAWWFSYRFPWTYDTRTLSAPWWSAMSQGQALSLFVRLAEETGAQRWDVAAGHTWQSFLQARSKTDPWSSTIIGGELYLEEYAGNQPPLQVLNGQIFALFGVHDYWRRTGDPAAARVFDGGATTVLAMMPSIRVRGGVSYYCTQPGFCQRPRWQDTKYHGIHSWQLGTLAGLTGDAEFSRWATLLREDWSAPSTHSLLRSAPPAPVPLDADPLDPEDGHVGG